VIRRIALIILVIAGAAVLARFFYGAST